MPGDAVADLVMRARRALRGDGGSSPSRGEADARAILSEGVRRLGEMGWGAEATELGAATQALAMMAGVHGEGSIHERWAAVPTGAARVAGWLGEEDGGAAMLERLGARQGDDEDEWEDAWQPEGAAAASIEPTPAHAHPVEQRDEHAAAGHRAFDVHMINLRKAGFATAAGSSSEAKWHWVHSWLDEHKPAVFIALEIEGRLQGAQRAGWTQRGYSVQYLAGSKLTNGVLMAVRREDATVVGRVRVCERGLGVRMRHAADGRVRSIVACHGLHDSKGFCAQVDALDAWLEGQGGGLAMADWNHTPCRKWRRPTRCLNAGDKRVRSFARWHCACCGGEAEDGDCRLVVQAPDEELFTRADKTSCSLIDYGIATLEADGLWRAVEQVPMDAVDCEGFTLSDHKLIVVRREIAQAAPGKPRPRPLRLDKEERSSRRRGDGYGMELGSARRLLGAIAGGMRWLLNLRHEASAAVEGGGAATSKVASGIMGAARHAKQKADAQCVGCAAAGGGIAHDRSGSTPKALLHMWRNRLEAAQRHRGEGADVFACTDPVLFHHKIKCIHDIRTWHSEGSSAIAWSAIVRKCRAEMRRADRKLMTHKTKAKRLQVEAARALLRDSDAERGTAQTRIARFYRAVRATRASSAMDTVHDNDRPIPLGSRWMPGEPARRGGRCWEDAGVQAAVAAGRDVTPDEMRKAGMLGANGETRVGAADRVVANGRTHICIDSRIHYTDHRFRRMLGRIGELFVGKMRNGAVRGAFEAWLWMFVPQFPTLRGIDGGEWDLQRELTWETFIGTLRAMPRGKAVGADGVSVEVLLAAGEGALRLLYDAMMADLRAGHVPDEWRQVLYALLVKPAPKNPERVCERREIALMSQTQKLLLAMVRWVCYRRLTGRLHRAQLGWLPGYGCTDVGLTGALLLQQARRLQHPLYVLYIDLATFFPAIDRANLRVAEMWYGLPKDVSDLAQAIYAGQNGLGITCRYDSADGLGDGFQNDMGALMGCVLSPDKAKILLDSVLRAIDLHARGVRVWGGGGRAECQRICQLAFADDWAGFVSTPTELERVWDIWSTWELLSGCKMGIDRKSLKTVVTGVRWRDGRAEDVADPNLVSGRGDKVPFIRYDKAYKHLGKWRCADASDKAGWDAMREAFANSTHRLRRMYKPTLEEFSLVSNALLCGLAEFHGQTQYVGDELAEEIERAWRRIYNAKFKRRRNTPRAELYRWMGHGTTVRRHVGAVANAALFTTLSRAAADAHDTQQRRATRSAIALAMYRWGCRCDPLKWDWSHLRGSIETAMGSGPCRYLGDAWMLLALQLKVGEAASEGTCSQSSRLWEWMLPPEEGDPLNADMPQWQAPESPMLFEPVTSGGLGCCVAPGLIEAGVVALGNAGRVGLDGRCRLVHSFEALQRACEATRTDGLASRAGLSGSEANRREWACLRAELRRRGLACDECDSEAWAGPTEEECVFCDEGDWADEAEAAMACEGGDVRVPADAGPSREDEEAEDELLGGHNCAHGAAPRRTSHKHGAAVDESPRHAAALWLEQRHAQGRLTSHDHAAVQATQRKLVRAQGGEATEVDWQAELQACFPGACAWQRPQEWDTGAADREAAAHGARVLLALGNDQMRATHAYGGEARWLSRDDVGEDGYVRGWQRQLEAIGDDLSMDREGVIHSRRLGGALDVDDVSGTGPSYPVEVQLMVRARAAIPPDTPVVDECDKNFNGRDEEVRVKARKRQINLAATAELNGALLSWGRRIRFTAAYTVDGSRKKVDTEDGPKMVSARAAVRHDGEILGGPIEELEDGADASDNYYAELAAQLDALNREEPGGRILIVCDAQSPVQALARFRRSHARTKQGYKAGRWIECWDRLIARHEAVVVVWQRSHVGATVNDWADIAADEAFTREDPVPVVRVGCGYASMRIVGTSGGLHRWAVGCAERRWQRKLEAAVHFTEWPEVEDIRLRKLPEPDVRTARAVAGLRLHNADVRAPSTLRHEWGCVCGCGERATWDHVHFRCQLPEAVRLRGKHRAALTAARREMFAPARGAAPTPDTPHRQLDRLIEHTRAGLPSPSSGGPVMPDLLSVAEIDLRRGVCGMFAPTGSTGCDARIEVRAELRRAAIAGLRLQRLGKELMRDEEEAFARRTAQLRLARKVMRAWMGAVTANGPARVSGLARVRNVSNLWRRALAYASAMGDIEDPELARQLREVQGTTAAWSEAAREDTYVPDRPVRAWYMASLLRWWAEDAGVARGGEADLALGASVVAQAMGDAAGPDHLRRIGDAGEEVLGIDENGADTGLWIGGVDTRAKSAFRHLMRGGGAGGVADEEAEGRRRAAATRTARQAAGLLNWLRHKNHACSREVLADIGEHVLVDCVRGDDANASLRRARRNAVAKSRRKRRRLADTSEQRAGRQAYADGYHEIEDVVEVRRFQGGKGRHAIQARVRWRGEWGPESISGWKRLDELTPSAADEARGMDREAHAAEDAARAHAAAQRFAKPALQKDGAPLRAGTASLRATVLAAAARARAEAEARARANSGSGGGGGLGAGGGGTRREQLAQAGRRGKRVLHEGKVARRPAKRADAGAPHPAAAESGRIDERARPQQGKSGSYLDELLAAAEERAAADEAARVRIDIETSARAATGVQQAAAFRRAERFVRYSRNSCWLDTAAAAMMIARAAALPAGWVLEIRAEVRGAFEAMERAHQGLNRGAVEMDALMAAREQLRSAVVSALLRQGGASDEGSRARAAFGMHSVGEAWAQVLDSPRRPAIMEFDSVRSCACCGADHHRRTRGGRTSIIAGALAAAEGDPMGALHALLAGVGGLRCAACGEDELTQRLSPPLHVRAGAPPLIVLEAEQRRVAVADPEAIHTVATGGAGVPPRYRLLSAVLFRPRSDELAPHYSVVWRGGEGRWWLMDDNANGAVAMELSDAARDAWCATRPDGWSPVLLTYSRVPD